MSGQEPIVQFEDRDATDVAAAVEGVMLGLRTPWLRQGAAQAVAERPSDAPDDEAAAQRFVTVVELAYLVASADGFAHAERKSLSYLLENVTGAAVKQAVLERHFSDLDQAVDALGRRARLARSAADIPDAAAREEALKLTALIAMADGTLSAEEMEALTELGAHMEMDSAGVEAVVRGCARVVQEALA